MAEKSNKYSSEERWTLFATILASSLVFIDSTALNVALPAIQSDINLSGIQLLWTVNSYLLFLSSLLLIGGAMGDYFGRNKIFAIGLIIFSIASFLCGISTSPAQLIIFRGLQGIGGALLTPGSLSIITAQFSSGKVGGAIGIWSTFSALTAVIGPILGGWLANMGLWRVIFFINVPFSILILWAILKKVPESKNSTIRSLDFKGAIFITLGLTGLTYGFIEASDKGFNNIIIIIALTIGAFSIFYFIIHEWKTDEPMMPLSLFNSKNFSITNINTLFIYGSLSIITFFLPLNLIQIQGYTDLQAGLSFLPTILSISILSPISGSLVEKIGARVLLFIGPIVTASAFLVFSTIGVTNGVGDYFTSFFIPALLLGIGMGITVAPLTTTVMRSVDKNNSGIASGVNNSVSRIAGVLSIAILGTVALYIFKETIFSNIMEFELNKNQITLLMDNASDFGATKIPEGLEPKYHEGFKEIVKKAFVKSFNYVSFITSGLTFLSAILSLLFVGKLKR